MDGKGNIHELVMEQFELESSVISYEPYGNGHINDTYLLTLQNGEKIILQKMNRSIFKQPVEVMENVMGVTSHLRNKILREGRDPDRETLTVIPGKGGLPYHLDPEGEYWRAYKFITDAASYDNIEDPHVFYECALAIGRFQRMLSDYPAHTLHETIEGFHDTAARYRHFEEVVKEDRMGRAAAVREEIAFARSLEEKACTLVELWKQGELPLRVTHNDTKLNNVMIDNRTGKAICVIDLDTVMPGLAAYDFGDAIRTGGSTGAEDEKDLSKIDLNMELYEAFTRGFLEGLENSLTPREIDLLPMGALVMTYESGIRFLADYLEGDVYFKIHRENHNLDRCRTQFKLVKAMLEKWDTMVEINSRYRTEA